MIDPCRIRLRAGKKNNRIEAEWHFGGYNQGYVMMIRDNSASGNKSARLTTKIITMQLHIQEQILEVESIYTVKDMHKIQVEYY